MLLVWDRAHWPGQARSAVLFAGTTAAPLMQERPVSASSDSGRLKGIGR